MSILSTSTPGLLEKTKPPECVGTCHSLIITKDGSCSFAAEHPQGPRHPIADEVSQTPTQTLNKWCGQKQRITKTRIKLYNHPKPSLFNCILSPEFHPKPCFWDPGHRHLKPPCVTQRPLSSRTATMEVPEAWATPSKGKTCEDERRSYLFTILMLFSYHNLKLQRN